MDSILVLYDCQTEFYYYFANKASSPAAITVSAPNYLKILVFNHVPMLNELSEYNIGELLHESTNYYVKYAFVNYDVAFKIKFLGIKPYFSSVSDCNLQMFPSSNEDRLIFEYQYDDKNTNRIAKIAFYPVDK